MGWGVAWYGEWECGVVPFVWGGAGCCGERWAVGTYVWGVVAQGGGGCWAGRATLSALPSPRLGPWTRTSLLPGPVRVAWSWSPWAAVSADILRRSVRPGRSSSMRGSLTRCGDAGSGSSEGSWTGHGPERRIGHHGLGLETRFRARGNLRGCDSLVRGTWCGTRGWSDVQNSTGSCLMRARRQILDQTSSAPRLCHNPDVAR